MSGTLVAALGWGHPAPKAGRWWHQGRQKSLESINSRLQLITKSVKYMLEYKQTLKMIRYSKTKLVILTNCPALRESKIEYYAMLAKIGVHHYSVNNTELGTAWGKYYRECTLAIIDPGWLKSEACQNRLVKSKSHKTCQSLFKKKKNKQKYSMEKYLQVRFKR